MKQLLILVHGCPVHALGAYGNEWVITPTLDNLAARGTVYDRHYATQPRAELSYDPAAKLFDFKDRHRAFEYLENQVVVLKASDLLPPWTIREELFAAYCDDLLELADEPTLLEPWTCPPNGWFDTEDTESWELLHRTFAAAVTQFDACLGDFLTQVPDDVTIAVTSDFGLPLGEHGLLGLYRPWLHEEYVHLPLIVAEPNDINAGRRVWDFTTPADLPLIMNGMPPLVRKDVVSWDEMNGFCEASIRMDDCAFLLPLSTDNLLQEPREPKMYLKPADRWELDDVRIPQLPRADELEARLREQLQQGRS